MKQDDTLVWGHVAPPCDQHDTKSRAAGMKTLLPGLLYPHSVTYNDPYET